MCESRPRRDREFLDWLIYDEGLSLVEAVTVADAIAADPNAREPIVNTRTPVDYSRRYARGTAP